MTFEVELCVDRLWSGERAEPGEIVRVRLSLGKSGARIWVDAPFHGDPPPPGPAGSTDGLWEFEVVELFLVGETEGAAAVPYTEIELAPGGHFLVLLLEGERQVRGRVEQLEFSTSLEPGRWRGEAFLPDRYLPTGLQPRGLVNAFAIHGEGARRRYLAARSLPGELPDFHQPRRFPTLEAFRVIG